MLYRVSPGGIFVSYRRQDSQAHTGRIYDRLKGRFGEDRVFIDVVSVSPGLDFYQVIESAVAGCDAMLVILGAEWLTELNHRRNDPDDFVVLEIKAGLTRGIPVIPVLLDGIEMPTRKDLPAEIDALASRQGFRLDHESFDRDMAKLSDEIARHTSAVTSPDGQTSSDTGNAHAHKTLGDLAMAVQHRCQKEISIGGLDKAPLPISWLLVRPKRWSHLRRDGRNEPLALDGSTSDIATVVRCADHRGRVAIVGDAGAGKTALALRLTLDLLAKREPHRRQPVPVFLRLSTWDPQHPKMRDLASWMTVRIGMEYGVSFHQPSRTGDVRAAGTGSAVVGALLRSGQLLPVLDGLDEVPASRLSQVLRVLARSVGDHQEMVVTCRDREYRAAACEPVLRQAVALSIQPAGANAVRDYLMQACGSVERSDAIKDMLEVDRRTGRKVVTDVLRIPLYASLARVAYAENAGDPTELLALSTQEVKDRLLDQIIPAAYPDPPNYGISGRSYERRDAHRWLTYVAKHLRDNCEGGRQIAWWELFDAMSQPTQVMSIFIVAGLVLASFGYLFVGNAGLGGGVAAAALFLLFGGKDGPKLPTGSRWMLRRSAGAIPRPPGGFFTGQIRLLAVIGVLVAVAGWIARSQGNHQVTILRLAVMAGVATTSFGLPTLLLAEFTMMLSPADVVRVVDPDALLRQGRWNMLAFGLLASILVLLGIYPAYLVGDYLIGWKQQLTTLQFLGMGLMFFLVACLAMPAWSRFQIARVYVFVVGGLPWRCMSFLRDAHERGVLRQVGGYYQFRHAELQDRLAPPLPAAPAPNARRVETSRVERL